MTRMTWQYFFMLLKSFSSCFLPMSSCHFLQYLVKAFFLDLCLQEQSRVGRGRAQAFITPQRGERKAPGTARVWAHCRLPSKLFCRQAEPGRSSSGRAERSWARATRLVESLFARNSGATTLTRTPRSEVPVALAASSHQGWMERAEGLEPTGEVPYQFL